MIDTDADENVSNSRYKVSFNLMQKELTSQQIQDVEEANS